MNTLSLISPVDVQKQLADYIKSQRKQLKLSRTKMAERSGVPAPTLKKFETTHQISLRQFILLWQSVESLDKLTQITEKRKFSPLSMEDIINHE